MRIFIDTSSLFKKYVDEPGGDDLQGSFPKMAEIVVSPTTWIEMNAAIERRLRSRSLSAEQADWLRAEAKRDFPCFSQVLWNENLESKAVDLIQKHVLKTMDAVQLASAILSESELFVTPDRKLYLEAKKVLRRA